ncbi:MAG: carbonic anhydrase [Acidimicrobiales bacterium]|nr:carbonic anhydrase [Acidimicrobiales bacterium]MCB1261533.1 carbonic anhydrase [Acidimicrobiales bacterium]
MSVERLARNGEAHRVAPEVAEMTAAPSLHTVVVTCMDARIDLFRILGLDLGEVHILRNAGAVVTDDVLRSLVVSQQMLGTTEIMLIGHTTCGLCGTTEEQVRAKVLEGTGQDAPFMFGSFDDLEASVRDGVRRLRSEPLLANTTVARGFVYDVVTGQLHEVLVEDPTPAEAHAGRSTA